MQFGRQKIYCDVETITDENVEQILRDALLAHEQNRRDLDYLYNYYKGNQPILLRTKTIRPEINNKSVENHANEIVSFKTGYLCGEPVQYVSRGGDESVSDAIGKLNDMMLLCNKSARDKELTERIYYGGIGHRMIMPNKPYIESEVIPKLQNRQADFAEDESPFNIYTLDSRNAFVVYYSGIGEPPVMGVKYVVKQDNTVVYSIYTSTTYYEFESTGIIGSFNKIYSTLRAYNAIPIIEYSFNDARVGIFEIVLSILDSINAVQSNRLDGIEQFIQSLMVLTNADIDEDAAKAIREAGLIKLKSFGDNKASVDILSEQLDQTQTQTLVDYMYQTVLNIVGMPNRNGGTSTSDTGSAVLMRDGWEAAEARAKSDELKFKESEQALLKIALKIMRATVGTPLKLSDVEIKFTRRNYENIQSKSQVFVSLMQSGYCALEEAYAISGISPDPSDSAKKGEAWHSKVQSELAKAAQVQAPPKAGDAGD